MFIWTIQDAVNLIFLGLFALGGLALVGWIGILWVVERIRIRRKKND